MQCLPPVPLLLAVGKAGHDWLLYFLNLAFYISLSVTSA